MKLKKIGLLLMILAVSGFAQAETLSPPEPVETTLEHYLNNTYNKSYRSKTDSNAFAVLGDPINTLSLNLAQVEKSGCFDKGESKAVSVINIGEIKTDVYSSAKSYATSLGVSGAMSAGYGMFTANADFSVSAQSAASSTGVVASWIYSQSRVHIYDTNNMTVNKNRGQKHVDKLDKAFTLYKTGDTLTSAQEKAVADFVHQCGAAVITSLNVGEIARLEMAITANDSATKDDLSAGFSADAGTFVSVKAKMEKASASKKSSFSVNVKSQSLPGHAMTPDFKNAANCQWIAENSAFNEACNKSITGFDETKNNIQKVVSPENTSLIKFPGVTLMSAAGKVLSDASQMGLSKAMIEMKSRYEEISQAWLIAKEKQSKINILSEKLIIPSGTDIPSELTALISEKALKRSKNNYDRLTNILNSATESGFMSTVQYADAKKLLKTTSGINLRLNELLDRLVVNPSNTSLSMVKNYILKTVNGENNHELSLIVDVQTYREVVLGGHVIYQKQTPNDANTQRPSQPDLSVGNKINDIYQLRYPQFCAYDDQPHELIGYAITTDSGKILPFVIHSLRHNTYDTHFPSGFIPMHPEYHAQHTFIMPYLIAVYHVETIKLPIPVGSVCSIVIDQNLNSIPKSSFDSFLQPGEGFNVDGESHEYLSRPNMKYWIWANNGGYDWDGRIVQREFKPPPILGGEPVRRTFIPPMMPGGFSSVREAPSARTLRGKNRAFITIGSGVQGYHPGDFDVKIPVK